MSYRNITSIIAMAFLSTALFACGGGGDSSSPTNIPTDTSLVFSTFPATYFSGGYSASYSLSGSSSTGDNLTGIWNIQSGSTTSFNSQAVTTIYELLSLTNTTTGVTVGGWAETYYSPDTNNLTLVGSYSAVDGVSSVATSTGIIPLSGSIGDFGMVGSYTHSDGTSSSITWSLADGYNGKANLVLTETHKDTSDALLATSVDTWTISQDGTRVAVNVMVTYHQLGNLTVIMSGNKS